MNNYINIYLIISYINVKKYYFNPLKAAKYFILINYFIIMREK